MKLDTDALGEFLRVADEGADEATEALSRLSGTEIGVETTELSMLTEADLRERFGVADNVGITIGLDGAFPGTTLLASDRAAAGWFVEGVRPEGEQLNAMDRSKVKEAASIAVEAFADSLSAWADDAVQLTPPTYYDRIDDATLLAGTPRSAALAFESELVDREAGVGFTLLTVPKRAVVDRLLTDRPHGEASLVSLDGLGDFDRLVRDGAADAAGLFTAITEIETSVASSRLRYTPVGAVPDHLGEGAVAGTVFGLNDGRDGYLAVLFDESSALAAADAMLPNRGADGLDDLSRSAIKEVGSVMTSGFLDGWGDLFDAPVDHTAPAFVDGPGPAVLEPVLRRVASRREHAFVVDTTLRAPDGGLTCTVLALPADHRLAELQSLRHPSQN